MTHEQPPEFYHTLKGLPHDTYLKSKNGKISYN